MASPRLLLIPVFLLLTSAAVSPQQPCDMPSLPPPREPNILTPEQAERLGDLIEQQIGRYYVLVGNRSLTQHPGDQATYVLKVAFAAGGPS